MLFPSFNLFTILLLSWLALAICTFILLFFVSAPYGRHLRKGWGPNLSNRLGWMIMEFPSALLMLVYYANGSGPRSITMLVFLIIWEVHYMHRTFIFPFRLPGEKKDMPIIIIFMGIFFNTGNTFFNGLHLFNFSPDYPESWLYDPRFIVGAAVFICGFVINQYADQVLFNLRKPGETGYKIPKGGIYRFISCPNYFGELLEWTGWAIATWSLAGLSFAVWTVANLIPRALSNHNWYKRQFPDYPKERKAIIPYIL
jgi:3-oxo-5-alpha-steroid 4-dehydrogenase 1